MPTFQAGWPEKEQQRRGTLGLPEAPQFMFQAAKRVLPSSLPKALVQGNPGWRASAEVLGQAPTTLTTHP